ncbi:MAG: alpha/beta hydrolase [Polyangiaceae bacterium]|nr:alpha/beta hydrolase [Polyangiaceae bacterium]
MPALIDPRRAHTFASLLRWLGPWVSEHVVPPGIRCEGWVVRDGQLHGHRAHRAGTPPVPGRPSRLEVLLYHPRTEPVGTYLIAPGLHFLGPDDPRLDRFCRILARAGFLVAAPFLPAYVDLEVRPDAPDDLELIARALLERTPPGQRPALFSISFGSWPALEVAARMPGVIDAVITFGGYADFDASVRFCVDGVMRTAGGDLKLTRDPLNSPALFLNLLRFLEVEGDTRALESAWREMVYRTWGRMELKAPGRLEPFARELVPTVPQAQRGLFLIGCGVEPGASELVASALRRAGETLAYASPRAALERIDCPVVVCHGRDDDVIPWGEAEKLVGAVPAAVAKRLYLTGLYGHTGAGKASPRDAVREVQALLGIARALAHAGQLRELL